MVLMEWQETFETGVPEFDSHHKHLFYLLNLAYDSITLNEAHERVQTILAELVKYVEYHFSLEEQWMEARNYPALSFHKEEHRKLTDRVLAFNNNSMNGEADRAVALVNFLMEWFFNHIVLVDAKYGEYAKIQGP